MKRVLTVLFVLLAAFTLVACGKESDAELVAAAKEELKVQFTVSGDSVHGVTGKLVLRNKLGDVSITWESSNPEVISVAGNVVQTDKDEEVTLTANLKLNDETDSKKFVVVVKAKEETKEPTDAPTNGGSEPGGTDPYGFLPEEFTNAAAGKKVYVASIGQSGELATINTLLSRFVYSAEEAAEFEQKVVIDAMLAANAAPNGSIVILIPAASGKGLGAAGTNLAAERARAQAFGARAAAGEIELYVVHIGGESRRGTDTDPLIEAAVEHASLVLVQTEGNSDGFFDNLGITNLFLFESAMAMADPFKQIFNR